MKAVVILQNADGSWAEKGSAGRCAFDADTMSGVYARARLFAKGRPHKIEVQPSNNMYNNPTAIYYIDAEGNEVGR